MASGGGGGVGLQNFINKNLHLQCRENIQLQLLIFTYFESSVAAYNNKINVSIVGLCALQTEEPPLI